MNCEPSGPILIFPLIRLPGLTFLKSRSFILFAFFIFSTSEIRYSLCTIRSYIFFLTQTLDFLSSCNLRMKAQSIASSYCCISFSSQCLLEKILATASTGLFFCTGIGGLQPSKSWLLLRSGNSFSQVLPKGAADLMSLFFLPGSRDLTHYLLVGILTLLLKSSKLKVHFG